MTTNNNKISIKIPPQQKATALSWVTESYIHAQKQIKVNDIYNYNNLHLFKNEIPTGITQTCTVSASL